MIVHKWDFIKREYEEIEVDSNLHLSTYELDMGAAVNCACCHKEMTFGRGYTSRQFHTKHGFGYCVCAECYEAEWEKEKEVSNEK